jgi:hypothetical protein
MSVDLGEPLFFLKVGHGSLKDFVVRGFATACGADDHETVTHLDGVVELEDLLNE